MWQDPFVLVQIIHIQHVLHIPFLSFCFFKVLLVLCELHIMYLNPLISLSLHLSISVLYPCNFLPPQKTNSKQKSCSPRKLRSVTVCHIVFPLPKQLDLQMLTALHHWSGSSHLLLLHYQYWDLIRTPPWDILFLLCVTDILQLWFCRTDPFMSSGSS